jgi:hypothetical protein
MNQPAPKAPAPAPVTTPVPRHHPRWPLIVWAFMGAASAGANGQTLPATPAPAMAQVSAQAVIANGAATNANGVLAVNETSGLANVQANQAVVSSGANSATAATSLQGAIASAKTASAKSSIEGNAFSNTSGVIAVNQSAGVGNLQRNSVVVGSGSLEGETVTDGVLSATSAKNGGLSGSGGGHGVREASISVDAFKNVTGIVQINQTAGSANVTANSFVLRPPAGTFFN